MAQGNHKLGKAKRSGGSQKRKTVKSVKKKRKGSTTIETNRSIVATTKAINSKNERIVAAKACNAGTNFFLKDISDKGELSSLCYCVGFFLVRFTTRFRKSLLELIIQPWPHGMFCISITFAGKSELKRQTSLRNKKEDRSSKLTDRLQQKLNKLK